MCISIAAFTKVISVNNAAIDLQNSERAFLKDRRALHLTLLKNSVLNSSASSFTQSQVSDTYKAYMAASKNVRRFLERHTWRNHRKVLYSTLLTRNGNICKVIRGRFMTRHCPTYFSLLKKSNDLRLKHESMLKAIDKSNRDLALIRSSLADNPITDNISQIPSTNSKLSIYSVLFLGFVVELCVLLLVTRRKQASSIILEYQNNKMLAKKFLIGLARQHYGVCDTSSKTDDLVVLFNNYGYSGNVTETVLAKMVSSFGASLGYDTTSKLKVALINANLIFSRVKRNTSYSC
jgi:hypothetical protein